MELNWSTFFLEILNFLVLLWILKRFLFKPVQETIARRKAQVDQVLASAGAVHAEAEALKSRYEHRLEAWEEEKTASRERLRQDLAAERERALTALRAELAQERDKLRVIEARQREDRMRKDAELCLQQGARFVSRLLAGLAGPELETRLLNQGIKQIAELPAQSLASLRSALIEQRVPISVQTAYPLSSTQRTQLAKTLNAVADAAVECRFSENADLLAGLRIEAGPWLLHANLADELSAFVESAHEQA